MATGLEVIVSNHRRATMRVMWVNKQGDWQVTDEFPRVWSQTWESGIRATIRATARTSRRFRPRERTMYFEDQTVAKGLAATYESLNHYYCATTWEGSFCLYQIPPRDIYNLVCHSLQRNIISLKAISVSIRDIQEIISIIVMH